MEIQQLMLSEILKYIDGVVRKAKVTIDGVVIEKEIHRTITVGNTLRKYVYLDIETGLISRAALVDIQGRELYVKELDYQKGANGFSIVFPITQEVMA
ncbi:hypothetical protein ACSVDA_15560 [Cytobacillus sp. Hm23]